MFVALLGAGIGGDKYIHLPCRSLEFLVLHEHQNMTMNEKSSIRTIKADVGSSFKRREGSVS